VHCLDFVLLDLSKIKVSGVKSMLSFNTAAGFVEPLLISVWFLAKWHLEQEEALRGNILIQNNYNLRLNLLDDKFYQSIRDYQLVFIIY